MHWFTSHIPQSEFLGSMVCGNKPIVSVRDVRHIEISSPAACAVLALLTVVRGLPMEVKVRMSF